MESLNPEFALYGSKYECARADTVFPPYLRSALGRQPLQKTLYLDVVGLVTNLNVFVVELLKLVKLLHCLLTAVSVLQFRSVSCVNLAHSTERA